MRSYRYVDGEYEIRNEIKHSLFIATAKGDVNQDEAEEFVKSIKKKYPDATHNCYAYVADEMGNVARFSDDGEPSGTAGQPILEVVKKHCLQKTAIVVTRYFGGIKLGAGGLVGAYTQAAADVIGASKISQKVECECVMVEVDYSHWSPCERLILKGKFHIGEIDYNDVGVKASVCVPTDMVEEFSNSINEATQGGTKIQIENKRIFTKWQ